MHSHVSHLERKINSPLLDWKSKQKQSQLPKTQARQ